MNFRVRSENLWIEVICQAKNLPFEAAFSGFLPASGCLKSKSLWF